MVQQYIYSKIWVEILYQFFILMELETISIPFETAKRYKSESPKMKIGVAGPIFTQNNIRGSMVKLYPYPTILEQNIVAIIQIYVARIIFLLLYDK